MLLGGKCKLSILFYIFLCSLILDSLILIHNNSLEWILMIWSHMTQNWISIAESNWIFSNLNIIDSHSYIYFLTL